jgi:hypothetical protein
VTSAPRPEPGREHLDWLRAGLAAAGLDALFPRLQESVLVPAPYDRGFETDR